MQVEMVKMERSAALAEHAKYMRALEQRPEVRHLRSLAMAYWHLSKGRGVLNIFSALTQGGVDSQADPRLAFAPAVGQQRIWFTKEGEGAGRFRLFGEYGRSILEAPAGTWPAWPLVGTQGSSGQTAREGYIAFRRRSIHTVVPVIPGGLVPSRGVLSNLFILWEVPQGAWVSEEALSRTPRDPFLLRRITREMYVVLAGWDMTPLERALIEGR